MAKEHPVFLDKLALALKAKYQKHYLERSDVYQRTIAVELTDGRLVKSEFRFKLLPEGQCTAPLMDNSSKHYALFDSLCGRAFRSTQMPNVVPKDHEACLTIVFTADRGDLGNVDVQVKLDEKGIIKVEPSSVNHMPDWDELRAKVQHQKDSD